MLLLYTLYLRIYMIYKYNSATARIIMCIIITEKMIFCAFLILLDDYIWPWVLYHYVYFSLKSCFVLTFLDLWASLVFTHIIYSRENYSTKNLLNRKYISRRFRIIMLFGNLLLLSLYINHILFKMNTNYILIL